MRWTRFLAGHQEVYAQQAPGETEWNRLTGSPLHSGETTGAVVTPPPHRLPVIDPAAILCIGLNYRLHAAEMNAPIPNHPVVFLKNPAAAVGHEQPVELPRHLRSDRVDYECELAVVIGRPCKNVAPTQALDYVLGFTCGNDVSARDWQKEHGGGQWCRGKSFDTFCPLGPELVHPSAIADVQDLRIETRINGELRQQSSTADMIFPVADLIAFLSGSMTLLPGTVILTGTPSGVGMGMNPRQYLAPGDTMEVDIEQLGVLRNPIIEESL